jgi:hypothetical protein
MQVKAVRYCAVFRVIGVINATSLLAAIGKGQAFNNPKEFAVWLGLTPNAQTTCIG